jgi:hypothetical protein
MCIPRYLREVEAGWEVSVRLLARHFLQFASSELEKSISRLSMWLVVAASLGPRDVPHHPQSAIRRDNKQSPFTMLDEPAFGQERLAISGTNHSPPIMLVVSSGTSKVNIRLEVCGVETAERCSSALGLQDSDFV